MTGCQMKHTSYSLVQAVTVITIKTDDVWRWERRQVSSESSIIFSYINWWEGEMCSSLTLLLRAVSLPQWFNWTVPLLTVDIISVKCFYCFISALFLIGRLCDNVVVGWRSGFYGKALWDVDSRESWLLLLQLLMSTVLISAESLLDILFHMYTCI